MSANCVSSISGLLPAPVSSFMLLIDDQVGWRLRAVLLDGSSADVAFSGGTNPRLWLAQHLTDEFGLPLGDAVEVARLLFLDYLPPEVLPDEHPQPYGMPLRDA